MKYRLLTYLEKIQPGDEWPFEGEWTPIRAAYNLVEFNPGRMPPVRRLERDVEAQS